MQQNDAFSSMQSVLKQHIRNQFIKKVFDTTWLCLFKYINDILNKKKELAT